MRRGVLRCVWLVALLLGSGLANAEYYSWFVLKNGTRGDGATPEAACRDYVAKKGWFYNSVEMNSVLGFKCWFDIYPAASKFAYENGARLGDSCPPNTIFNPANGVCEPPPPPPCQNKPPAPFSKSGSGPDPYMTVVTIGGKPTAIAGTEGCFNGCLASTTDQKCTVTTAGAYLCRGTAHFSGQECGSSGAPSVDSSSSAAYPEPQTNTQNEPCNYVTQADGTQTCTSKNSEEKEGQYCGTVNGVPVCIDKPPTKDATQIDTTVATASHADGSSTTTKTDTATSTTCSGVNSCQSNTTTTTTTTSKNGAGSTTSVSSSCTGSRCPDANTNPDGNGDGLGDCVGGECGEGGGGGFGGPEFGEVDDYQTTTQKFFTSVKGSPLATAVTAIQVPQGGTAPELVSAPLAAIGGASFDLRIITDLKPVIADVLSAVMKAFWCFVALMIFLMG